ALESLVLCLFAAFPAPKKIRIGACIQATLRYFSRFAVSDKPAQPIFVHFMATANDIRRGMAINYNGDIAVVLDTQHRTPGNLRAFVQATIRSIRSGKSSDVRFSSTERIEVVPMNTRNMEFSHKDGEDFVFSDPETFETVTLSPEIVGEAKHYMVENNTVTVT